MGRGDAAIGSRLQRARRALGLTQGEVGKAMGMVASTISAIESGKRSVSGAELHAFARHYRRPMAYFFEEEPKESPDFLYLFRAADSEVLDREAILQFQDFVHSYALLEQLVDAPPLPLPPDYSPFGFRTDRDAETLADMERARLGLGDAPVSDLELMNLLDGTVGVRVLLVPVRASLWSGLVVRDPGGRPCVAVNAKEEQYRRNFDLAHEYGHVLVHLAGRSAPAARIDKGPEFGGSSADERFADAFASAFLMPRRAVLRQLDQVLGASGGQLTGFDLVHLSMHFGVSGQAMSRRLVALRKLPRQVHQEFWSKHGSFKNLAETLGYEVDWSRDPILPARFRYLAAKAYDEERISLAKLAELLGEDYLKLRRKLAGESEEAGIEAAG